MNYRFALLGLVACPLIATAQTSHTAANEAVEDSIFGTSLAVIGVVDALPDDDDGDASQQEVSSTVVLQNDVFLRRASFQLSQAYFKVRGYENQYQQKFINGVHFNNQYRGTFNYSAIGALNDVTRNGDVTNYTAPSSFTYGSLGGGENIMMRAGDFARGGKVTLSLTNRSYFVRAMATYSTGLLPNGWAFTASVGGRYSSEGNVEGTFYRNFSYAMLLEKRWRNASLSLVTFGSPVKRGQAGASLQEVYDLVDNNQYNPNWGYQSGKKRNARVVTAFDPTTILSLRWNISPRVRWDNGISFHYAYDGRTALNWYNAPDPRPDYYRYLPSYFEDADGAEAVASKWRSKDASITQINWDNLYQTNYENVVSGDGSALYMIEERRSDLYETTFNSTLNATISRHNTIIAGLGLRNSLSRNFKTVKDLMGSNYVLDIDKYSEQDFSGDVDKMQNDLNRPNRKVYEGGIFGYNYNININSANLWVVNMLNYSHWEGYYGLKYTRTEFQRDGKMRNGRYPTSSYGKGVKHTFDDMGIKAGLTFKISGNHFITGNISYATEAPLPYNSYISPRITDNASDLESGRIFSADIAYVVSLPRLRGRVSLFQTNFYNMMDRSSYYDATLGTYVNHELKGLNVIHRGLELGLTYKIDDQWTIDFAGSTGQYFYNNNPMGTVNSENGLYQNISEKVYMKGLHVGGTPQTAATLGLRYFINYWFLGANVNYFARNFVDSSPIRRLASVYESVDASVASQYAAYLQMITQEEYDAAATVDLSVGKVFYLKNRKSINFNLSVNNILNNVNVRTGGYEQGRLALDYPNRFKSKYYYMQGINAFLNVSYNF